MSGTVKVIKVLASERSNQLRYCNESGKVIARHSFEGGKFVVRVGGTSQRKQVENEAVTTVDIVQDISPDPEPTTSAHAVPNDLNQEIKVEEAPDFSNASEMESAQHHDGYVVVLPSDAETASELNAFAVDQDGSPIQLANADLTTMSGGLNNASPISRIGFPKLVTHKPEPCPDLSVADPCCYPPSERTVHLLKMLAGAEILSIKELAEIVAYITYLRRRKLVTDYLLKESPTPQLQEPDLEPDDEPPLVRSSVRFPVKTEKRSFVEPSSDLSMAKMPRLMNLLKGRESSSSGVHLIADRVDMSQWPFNLSPQKLPDDPSILRTRPKLKPIKVMANCEMCGTRVNEKQLKAHHRTCRGVIVKWRRGGEGEAGAGSEGVPEERRERVCPRCEKVLSCDRDFEMHMAVAHRFYWRLDFANETEFDQWFRGEGLDETMIAGPSKYHGEIHEKVFYCAINGGARMKVKCPCRLAIKKGPNGVVARYSVLHNHAERFVRQQMSNECRDMILEMLKVGMRNYEILKTIKETYPKTSMNYLVTSQAITRLRYRYHRSRMGKRTGSGGGGGSGAVAHRKRGRRPAAEVESQRMQFGDFGDEKGGPEGSVWPLPELQCDYPTGSNHGDCPLIN